MNNNFIFKLLHQIRNIIFLIIPILFFVKGGLFSKDLPSQIKENVTEAITIKQNIQKEEDKWIKERKKLEAEYETLRSENKAISDEISKLKKEIASHKKSISKIEKDISKIEKIKEQIDPFLKDTYNRLLCFIKEDLPFLKKERRDRLNNLKQVLYNPSVSINEKFRRLMEVLFIEAEYGNTIEVYQERIKVGKEMIYANIFRLGRISLFFQSLDGKISGYFDPSFGWRRLSERYNKGINVAIDMAEKRRPVDIIDLPIGRIKR